MAGNTEYQYFYDERTASQLGRNVTFASRDFRVPSSVAELQEVVRGGDRVRALLRDYDPDGKFRNDFIDRYVPPVP